MRIERTNNHKPAIAFPNSNYFHPTNGKVVGTEFNEDFNSFRYIFKYDSEPIRKSTGKSESWPNGELYLTEREVKFFDAAK